MLQKTCTLLLSLLTLAIADTVQTCVESSHACSGSEQAFFIYEDGTSEAVQPPEDAYLLFLPSYHPEILFNMQTRRLEEMLHIARMSGRILVAPVYYFGKRNWTWFEHGGNDVADVRVQWNAATEGLVIDSFTDYFNASRVQDQLLPRGMVNMFDFHKQTGGRIDTVVRMTSPGEADHPFNVQCFEAAAEQGIEVSTEGFVDIMGTDDRIEMEGYGLNWSADRVSCTGGGPSLSHVLEGVLRDHSQKVVAIHNYCLYALGMDWRFESWERPQVRQALSWREDRIRGPAREFVKQHFSGAPFIAVHWRRGDWKNLVDASLAQAALMASCNPRPFVHYIKTEMARTGITNVFLAHNSGKKEDLEYVQKHLPGLVTYPASGDWHESVAEAVIEQAICSMADFFIIPPCVGPKHVSSFSRFILDERELQGMGENTFSICCGEDYESMEVLIAEPHDGSVLSDGKQITVAGFAMILHQGSHLFAWLDELDPIPCDVGVFYCKFHFYDVAPGQHVIRVGIKEAASGVIHPTQAQIAINVQG